MLPQIEFITPILNVSDVPESIAWFEKLGWHRIFTWNNAGVIEDMADRDDNGVADFAGIASGSVQVFLCLDAQGSRGGKWPMHGNSNGGTWISLWASTPQDLEKLYQAAIENEIKIELPVTDQPWGAREFRIMHPDGHILRINVVL